MTRMLRLSAITCLLITSFLSAAQESGKAVIPTLVRFTGTVHDVHGKPLTGTVGITFTLHTDATTSAALWTETQNVQLDSTGHYSVLLGNTKAEGLPVELFTTGEAHWLGVHAAGLPDSPRVLLVSVPYALKAHDAETVGGLPASAFALRAGATSGAFAHKAASKVSADASNLNVTTPGGTNSWLPKFDSSADIVSSAISEIGGIVRVQADNSRLGLTGTGDHYFYVDRGGVKAALGINAEGAFLSSLAPNVPIRFYVNDDSKAHEAIHIAGSGNVGLGTSTPSAQLHVVREPGNSPAATFQLDNGFSSAPIISATETAPTTGNPKVEVFRVGSNGFVTISRLSTTVGGGLQVESAGPAAAVTAHSHDSSQHLFFQSGVGVYALGGDGAVGGGAGVYAVGAGSPLGWPGGDGIEAEGGYMDTGGAFPGINGMAARFRTGGGQVVIGDPSCSDGSFAAIGFFAFGTTASSNNTLYNCSNYSILSDVSHNNTLFNRPTGGYFNFQENASGAQLVIAPGGHIGIATALNTTPANIFTIAQGSGHAIADGWDTFSSGRWKTNIQTLNGALAKVVQLRGVSYDYTPSQRHDIGMIAEEVGKVVPEVVTFESNGKDAQSIDYARLTAVLVEAVKEQQKEIQQLQSEVKKLRKSRQQAKPKS